MYQMTHTCNMDETFNLSVEILSGVGDWKHSGFGFLKNGNQYEYMISIMTALVGNQLTSQFIASCWIQYFNIALCWIQYFNILISIKLCIPQPHFSMHCTENSAQGKLRK